jgi:hypothetical protein
MLKKKSQAAPQKSSRETQLDKHNKKISASIAALEKAEQNFEAAAAEFRKAEKENAEKAVLFPLLAFAKIAKAKVKIAKITYKLAKFALKNSRKKIKQGTTKTGKAAKNTDAAVPLANSEK